MANSNADCAICKTLVGAGRIEPLFEDELWHVRHTSAPYGVPGWMMMISKRHVSGPAEFNAAEVLSFGPALHRFERVLLEVSGALRIYTAALGESSPHFHAHMVPHYPTMPKGALGWAVFDLERAARAGEITVDADEVKRLSETYRRALSQAIPR